MQIRYFAKQIELTNAVKEYVHDRLTRVLDGHGIIPVRATEVELSKETGHHSGKFFRAEIMVRMPNKTLRVEEMAESIIAAFDLCIAKLKVLVEKYKGKHE